MPDPVAATTTITVGHEENYQSGGGTGGMNEASEDEPDPHSTSYCPPARLNGFKIDGPNDQVAMPQPEVGLTKFVFLAFFLTCGGPYGIEDAVGAAGPLLTLCAFVALPIVWAVPQALMTAELATMMAENGGYIVWVQRAFGDFLGWVNAYDRLFCNVFDLALYPVIIVDYLHFPMTPLEKYLIKCGIVLFVAILNIYGLDLVGSFSIVLTAVMLTPFLLELGWVIGDRNIKTYPKTLFEINKKIDWGLFTGTMLWSYTGWDSLGTFAAEVKNPKRTYPLGIFLVLILCTLNYIIPVLVGYLMYPYADQWHSGTFSIIGNIVGRWLGIYLTIGAIVASFGEINCELASTARALWAMGVGKNAQLKVPRAFGYTWQRRNTPLVSIVAITLVLMGLVVFDFGFLVQVDTFLSCLTLLFEFAAFMVLKYKEPFAPRPYVVPGGMFGAWLITIPKVLVVGFTLIYSNVNVALVSGAINVFVILAYGVRICTMNKNEAEYDDMDKNPRSPASSGSGPGGGGASADSDTDTVLSGDGTHGHYTGLSSSSSTAATGHSHRNGTAASAASLAQTNGHTHNSGNSSNSNSSSTTSKRRKSASGTGATTIHDHDDPEAGSAHANAQSDEQEVYSPLLKP